MAPRVMTVSGPIPPEKVGFTLPHEHTGIYLWHIPDRWDYWELTPDELIDRRRAPRLPTTGRRDDRRPHPAGHRARP